MNIQRLIELHAEGKNDSEIALELNVKRQAVQYNRKKLGLNSNFSYKSFRKMDYEKVEKLVKENKTDKEIAEIVGVKPISIYFFRKRNNIERDNLALNKAIEITPRQLSIIKGSLLGDASLRKTNINPNFTCEHGIKQLNYCKWKHEELKSLGSKFAIRQRKTVDSRTGIYYKSAVCTLPANPNLLPIYNNLYINGVKTITEEFLKGFNELSLAVMFMDDGYKIGKTVGISTCCFSKKELSIFNDYISKKFGIVFNIDGNNYLYLPTNQYTKFKSIVLPYMQKELLYKLSVT